MAPRVEGPLTAEDLDGLNVALRHLAQAQRILDKCKACGIECEQWCQYADILQSRLEAMRREFFNTLGEVKE